MITLFYCLNTYLILYFAIFLFRKCCFYLLIVSKANMRLLVLISFMCVSLQVFGQEQEGRQVHGIVQDTSGVALEGVNVFLIANNDTAKVITNENGQFLFKNVTALSFRISYSLLGFQIYDEQYIIDPSKEVKFINVNLKRQATVLRDVNIYGMLPVLVKDDTIQYNARAYTIMPGDLVEDLMKKFVGIDIDRSGLVRAQGQTVTRVKVNGKDFFTGDVLTATRNLPAEIVDNIQVIDDYGEQAAYTGVKKDNAEKIININLKKDKNRGFFGQVTGGVGTEGRYIGSLAANNFDDTQQISLLGSINNTNNSLFSYGDVSGSGSRDRGGMDLNSMVDMNDGINLTNSIGVNYRDAINANTNIYGGYVFTDRESRMNSFSFRESVYKNNTLFTENNQDAIVQDNNHKLSLHLESQLDSSMFLKISPTLSYNTSSRFANSIGKIQNRRLSTQQQNIADERQQSPTFNLESFFNKGFARQGRNLSFELFAAFNEVDARNNVQDRRLNIDSTDFYRPVQALQRLNQLVRSQRVSNEVRLSASYIEPITSKSFLELNYEVSFSEHQNNRNAIDFNESETESLVSDTLKMDYSYTFLTNKVGFLYQYNDQRVTYQVGFGFQPTRLSGSTFNREISTTKESINFVPNARFTYKVNNLSSLTLVYKGQNNQPSFYQIQPVMDNSNPQDLLIGNPELQAEFVNDVSLQYRSFNLNSGNTFFSNLAFKGIKNKIVTTRTMVPNSTIQETGFVNTSGYFDMHAYYMYSLSLIEKELSINLSSSLDYNNNITFINEEKNRGRNLNVMHGLQVNYAISDWFSLDVRSSYSVSKLNNSLPAMFNAKMNTVSLGIGSRAFLKQWVLSFDLGSRINKGYSELTDTNPTLLNFYVERSFGKNDRGIIRLQAFDLLNENTGITSEVNGGDTYYLKNDRLRRYFLLSFNYRLQKFPTKS